MSDKELDDFDFDDSTPETPAPTVMYCSGCEKELDWHGESNPVQLIERGEYRHFHDFACVADWANSQTKTKDEA